MADKRYAMNVRLTQESKDHWELFAAELGVTVTALLEVAGQLLQDVNFREHWKVDPKFQEMVDRARTIDNERRKRS